MKKYDLLAKTWYICFDDKPDDKPDNKPDNKPDDKPDDDGSIKFTEEQQKHINKLIAEEKRKQQEKTKAAVEELEALRKKSNLTKQEKEDYEKKLIELRKSLMTKEELAKEEASKMIKDYEKKISESETESIKWKNLYNESTIKRSITDAAALHKAFNPEQIVAMLRPITQLVEATDEEGKSLGYLVPTVDYMTYDATKKPITLKLAVEKAVEKMKEDERFQNLFIEDGTGGAGLMNKGRGGSGIDIVELAKDPVAYAKARVEGKLDKLIGPVKER